MIRIFDIVLSLIGLSIASPVFLILIIAIKLDSKGSAFYMQTRVGQSNSDFSLFKFRSMKTGADKFGLITVGGRDSRITKVGYFIRKYKFDELPQLLNVLKGDMSIVGPRPEVRKYVDLYTKEQSKVLSVKPGISDYASIEYMDENEILGKSSNPDKDYVDLIMPAKIELNMRYINNRTIIEYFKIIFLTVFKIFR